MKKITTTILVTVFIATTAASTLPIVVVAQDLEPLHAGVFHLGQQSVVVYYTENSNNYEVVTTIGPNLDSIGEPIRHVASVAPGQSYRIEFGRSDKGRPHILTITRVNDTLSVNAIDNIAVQAETGSADKFLENILDDYHHLSQRGQWANPWMPAATGNPTIETISADQRLTEIVATYTRETLDRGGWINTFLHNADYASGNPLLAVNIGEGVTDPVVGRLDL